MSPLIATLGVMTSLRGAGYLITDGLPVFGFGKGLSAFGRGYFLGIPDPVILMVVIFALGIFILSCTPIGRYVYGVGGNEEASRLSGVSIGGVKIFCYAFSAMLTGIAGLVLLSRTNSGQPAAGVGFEMDAITAVVLDRGGAIQGTKMDFLKESEASADVVGKQNVTYEIVRWGW